MTPSVHDPVTQRGLNATKYGFTFTKISHTYMYLAVMITWLGSGRYIQICFEYFCVFCGSAYTFMCVLRGGLILCMNWHKHSFAY